MQWLTRSLQSLHKYPQSLNAGVYIVLHGDRLFISSISSPQQYPLDLICRGVPFKMISPNQILATSLLLILIHGVLAGRSGGFRDDSTSFDQNYAVTWGNNNIVKLDRGREIQLSMDKSSGISLTTLPLSLCRCMCMISLINSYNLIP